jgi:hypothetical protein
VSSGAQIFDRNNCPYIGPGRIYRVKKCDLTRGWIIKWVGGHHLSPKSRAIEREMQIGPRGSWKLLQERAIALIWDSKWLELPVSIVAAPPAGQITNIDTSEMKDRALVLVPMLSHQAEGTVRMAGPQNNRKEAGRDDQFTGTILLARWGLSPPTSCQMTNVVAHRSRYRWGSGNAI